MRRRHLLPLTVAGLAAPAVLRASVNTAEGLVLGTDGRGAFVRFQGGDVYWSSRTGATMTWQSSPASRIAVINASRTGNIPIHAIVTETAASLFGEVVVARPD